MWKSKKVRGKEEGELERAETGKFREKSDREGDKKVQKRRI